MLCAMRSLRTVAVLILAICILQVAGGLLGVWLPLAMADDGLSKVYVGAVAATYSAGFMGGAALSGALLRRIGHIRVFSAAAGVCCAMTLFLFWADGVIAWALLRMPQGACIAILFATSESWMNTVLGKDERGSVLGVYFLATKVALAGGPFLGAAAAMGDPAPLMVAAACFALCLVPICWTAQTQPQPPQAAPMAIGSLFQTAPAAVIAAFLAGMSNNAVLGLAPLYARDRGEVEQAPLFLACAWAGSLATQWVAGWASDKIDRRLVIAALNALGAAGALAIFLLPPQAGFHWAMLGIAVWGAGSLSYYGIAVAHMADRTSTANMAHAVAGLLFVWAIGSIFGPLIAGFVADRTEGARGLFGYAAIIGVLVCVSMGLRLRVPGPARAEKGAFAPQAESSVAAGEALALTGAAKAVKIDQSA